MNTVEALVIEPGAELTALHLPDSAARWKTTLAAALNAEEAEPARYHRQATMYVDGDGLSRQRPLNLAAWALASTWRGLEVTALYGPVAVTGADPGTALPRDLADQVRDATTAVNEVLQEWLTRRPISDDAAAQELLAAVHHHIPTSSR